MRFRALLCALLAPVALHADTIWNGSGGSQWSLAANWTGGLPGNVNAATNAVIIGAAGLADPVLNHDLGNDWDLYAIRVNSNVTGQVVLWGNSLDLYAGGIDLTGAGADLRIISQFDVSANHPWTVPAGRVLELFDVDGTATATLGGAGTVRLSGFADNATPVFIVNAGVLELNKSTNTVRAINGTGTSATINNGATLRLIGSGNDQIGNDVDLTLNAGGTFDLNGRSETWDGLAGAGTLTNLGGTNVVAVINQTGAASTFTGFISNGSGGLALTKGTGGAVAYLNPPAAGQITYTGLTTITGGALALNAFAYADIMGLNRIVLNGGALESDATRTAPAHTLGTGLGQVHFAGNGGFSARGADATVTLNGGAPLTWGVTPSFVATNTQLLFGSGQSTRTAILANDLDLGGSAGTLGSLRVLNGGGGAVGLEGRLAGRVTGPSGIYKQGNSAIDLANAANAYEGGTFANAGALAYDAPGKINADGPLGLELFTTITSGTGNYGGSAACTAPSAGAPIPTWFYETLADWSQPKTVVITGTNADPVDFNLAPAGLRDDLYLGAAHGATFTQNGTVSPVGNVYRLGGGGGSLLFDTTGDLAAGNDLVVRDGGMVILNAARQPLDGAVTIHGGALEFRGDVGGLAGTADVTVNGMFGLGALNSAQGGYNGPSGTVFSNVRAGGLLIVKKDPQGTTLGGRRVILNGGVLSARDNTTTAGTVTVSNVVARLGFNQIAHQPVTGTAAALDQLSVVNLARRGSAIVEFRSQVGTLGARGDNGRILLANLDDGDGAATPVALLNGILGGWAYASNNTSNNPRDFATWTPADGVAVLTIPTANQTTGQPLSTALATENWLVNATLAARNTVTNHLQVNSLTVERNVALQPDTSLTLGSGGLLFRGNPGGAYGVSGPTNSFVTSAWNSGLPGEPNQLFLHSTSDTGQDTRIHVPVRDPAGAPLRVVKTGTGNLILNQDNAFTGGIEVNFGVLVADFRNSPGVIDDNDIVVRAGGNFTTALLSSRAETLTGDVLLDGGTLRNTNHADGSAGNVATWTGTLTVNSLPGGQAIIDAASGRRIILSPSAVLTGAGNLYKTGDSVLEIQTASTTGFTGNLHMNQGNIELTGAGRLPEVNLYQNGGSLVLNTTRQRLRNLASTGGAVTGSGASTVDELVVTQTVDAAYHGSLTSSTLVKQGPAHLLLSGNGDNGGQVLVVNEGTLSLAKISANTVHSAGGGAAILTVNSNAVARLGGSFLNTGGAGINNPPAYRVAGVSLTFGAPGYAPNYVDQIYYQGDVVINRGTFDLNGRSESIDILSGGPEGVTLNGGATDALLLIGHNNGGGSYNGVLRDGPSARLGLVKLGSAVQILTGTNTYSGITVIEAGTLRLSGNGALTQTPAVWVNTGATLDVAGVTAGPYTLGTGQRLRGLGNVTGHLRLGAGAAVHPGDSGPGTLTTQTLSLGAGSTYAAELNTASNRWDRLTITGDLNLAGGAVLALTDLQAGAPTAGTKYALASYTGVWNGGTFQAADTTPIPDDSLVLVGGLLFRVDYNDTTDGTTPGKYLTLTVEDPVVPYLAWAQSYSLNGLDLLPDADPDGDGELNLVEFAFAGNPTSTVASARLANVSTNGYLFTTVPVRNGAVFSGAPDLHSAPVDGLIYRAQGSENLAAWLVAVEELTPAITNSLPASPAGWSYRTFRFVEPVSDPRVRGYLRVGAEAAP